jgi:lactoylglutathione lyase
MILDNLAKQNGNSVRKIFLLLMVLSFTRLALAQETDPYNFNLNHIAISVKDVNRSAAFYGQVLKLEEITNRSKLEGVRWFSLGEGKELHLISIVKENVTTNKALHLALTTSNFDSFVRRLDSLKLAYSDWAGTPHKLNIRADGVKQAFFQDPDGYWIEVNSVAKKE